MITTTQHIAMTMTTAVCPAFLTQVSDLGASVSGRRVTAGIGTLYGVRVPAFRKDALPGVRAWSPPV